MATNELLGFRHKDTPDQSIQFYFSQRKFEGVFVKVLLTTAPIGSALWLDCLYSDSNGPVFLQSLPAIWGEFNKVREKRITGLSGVRKIRT